MQEIREIHITGKEIIGIVLKAKKIKKEKMLSYKFGGMLNNNEITIEYEG